MSVRTIALERDDLGVDWPIPTANIASLGRTIQYNTMENLHSETDKQTVGLI